MHIKEMIFFNIFIKLLQLIYVRDLILFSMKYLVSTRGRKGFLSQGSRTSVYVIEGFETTRISL